jgi:hypothetical protein
MDRKLGTTPFTSVCAPLRLPPLFWNQINLWGSECLFSTFSFGSATYAGEAKPAKGAMFGINKQIPVRIWPSNTDTVKQNN